MLRSNIGGGIPHDQRAIKQQTSVVHATLFLALLLQQACARESVQRLRAVGQETAASRCHTFFLAYDYGAMRGDTKPQLCADFWRGRDGDDVLHQYVAKMRSVPLCAWHRTCGIAETLPDPRVCAPSISCGMHQRVRMSLREATLAL